MDLKSFITHSLEEDIGNGDHTSLACIPANASGKAQLIVKENCILAGVELAKKIFLHIEPKIKITIILKDGSIAKKGSVAFFVEGKIQTILKAERLVLNCMQRMSGIATITNKMVEQLKGTKAKLLDTRKTTPNFRALEKCAVKIGGGENHRPGLYDMILIKDNHIDYAGGISNAVSTTKKYLKKKHKNLKIEIEARSINEVKEVISIGGIDRIMLDNFTISKTKEAVKLIGGMFEIETSGNINFENIRKYAECGVDYISVGALTHSYKSIDLSLKAMK